jgi:hypothetical protein
LFSLKFANFIITNNRSLSLLRFTVSFRDTGVGVRFVFVVISLPVLFPLTIIDDFLVGYVPLSYPTTSHRRFALRALSFVSFSPTLSLHHILADPLSALQHSRHTEEGRVNG